MWAQFFSCSLLLIPSMSFAADVEEPTRMEWVRRAPGGEVRVTGTKTGTGHAQANAEIQKVADIIDGIVTLRQHVIWHKITWRDGRIRVEAVAESATFANVATIAMHRFFPNHLSAGTGITQIRRAPQYNWRLIIQLNPKKKAERR